MRASPQRYLPPSRTKIYLDNNGMIGLAPAGTRPGDAIWQVDDPDPLVIARKTAEGHEVVARSTRYITPPGLGEPDWLEPLLHCHLAFTTLIEK